MSGPTAIRVRPILLPDPAPPQPGARLSLVEDRGSPRYCQPTLELAFVAPTPFVPVILHGTENAATHLATRSRSQNKRDPFDDDGFFERQMTPRSELPAPAPWAYRFAQAVVEVSAGRRSAQQIARWSTTNVLNQLKESGAYSASRGPKGGRRDKSADAGDQGSLRKGPPRQIVSRVRVDEPADGVAEVAAVVQSAKRTRALMLRLEGWDGRWICTYAELL